MSRVRFTAFNQIGKSPNNAIKAHPWLGGASLLTAAKTTKNLWYDREWKDYTSLQKCVKRNLLQIPVVAAIAYGTFRLFPFFKPADTHEAFLVYIPVGPIFMPLYCSAEGAAALDRLGSVLVKVALAAGSLMASFLWLRFVDETY